MSARQDALDEMTSALVDVFRPALMDAQYDDGGSQIVSSAAHVCAEALAPVLVERFADITQLHCAVAGLMLSRDSGTWDAQAELANVLLRSIAREPSLTMEDG